MTRRFHGALALGGALIGASALAGWVSGRMGLASFGLTFIPMAPSTAIFFLTVGSSLALALLRPGRVTCRAAEIIGMVIALHGLSVAVGFFLGRDFGLDRLLVPEPERFGQVPLGRMSPITSSTFMLDGLALALWARARRFGRKSPALGAWAALGAFLVTFTVLLGYAYRSPLLYGGTTIPMALTTALAFLTLDVSLLLAVSSGHGPISALRGESTRAQLMRAFLPIVILSVIVDGGINAYWLADPSLNQALLSSLTALGVAVVTIAITTSVAAKVGARIDRAEEERRRADEARIEAQEQLQHQAQMAAIGAMAGTIVHEINNPMSIILAKTQQLQRLMASGDRESLERHAQNIVEMAQRVIGIVNSMRDVSRQVDGDAFEKADLKHIVQEGLALSRGRCRSGGIRVEVKAVGQDHGVKCRPSQILQVLLNLLNNACDAVEEVEDRWISIQVRDDDEDVELSVEDGGHGIPRDVVEKVMEPFFTLKPRGKGTGLGLSISQKIVKGHGGTLRLDSESKHTRFVLRLPKEGDERHAVN